MKLSISEIVKQAPVIPVLVVDNVESAVPLARALCEAGLPVLEVTLRTDAALDVIRAIADQVPEAIVGAGTVMNPSDLDKAIDAGALFHVSPGSTPALINAVLKRDVAMLPGVATASEVMALHDMGFDHLKFFPAERAGGIGMLKAIGGPIPQVKFCPTGGVSLANAADYLALKNVACVGGSWMATAELVNGNQWEEIKTLAAAAASLGR